MDLQARIPTLRINLDNYPISRALKEGQLRSELAWLDFCGPSPAHRGFKDMVQDDRYDAGELAVATYLQAHVYGKPYVLLPYPTVGRLQFHTAVYNGEFGALRPKDIEGKRVGVRSYGQTTGLYMRGVLRHEYGVDLDKVQWMTTSGGHLAEYQEPSNCQRLPAGSSVAELLLKGDLTAALLGRPDMPDDARIDTLVPDARQAAQSWFEREGIVPINHMFAVHRDLSRQRPDIVREIWHLLVESRNQTAELPENFPPLGLEANRRALQLAIDWALEQRIIQRRLTVDELFDDLTASLG